MKKIAAIFSLLLFSFNLFGYLIVFDLMEKEANTELEFSLDDHSYNESQLIELKIPVHLPYQTSWTEFQRYNGEVTVNGVVYKYVKRKLANDTLYLKCIADIKKMKLQKAKNDFFCISNDLAQSNSAENPAGSKSVLKYLQSVFSETSFHINICAPLILRKDVWFSENRNMLQSAFLFMPEQPPDNKVA